MLKYKSFYISIILFSIVGYIYLFYSYKSNVQLNFTPCFYKNIFSIPCPTCGTTRGYFSSLQGDFYKTFFVYNPLGLLYLILSIFFPIVLIFDLIFKKQNILNLYNYILEKIKEKKIWIPLVFFLILNWIWNFYKEL